MEGMEKERSTADNVGKALKLPPQFEPNREEIEKTLIPVIVNGNN